MLIFHDPIARCRGAGATAPQGRSRAGSLRQSDTGSQKPDGATQRLCQRDRSAAQRADRGH